MATFSAALGNPQLLGGPFQAPSFASWHVIAKLIDGAPLTRAEVELVKRCTGRKRIPASPMRRLYLLCGRRAGKSRFLSALACWIAALAADWQTLLSPGERGVVLLIGTDKKQAAVLRRYCSGLLQTGVLAQQVTNETADTIEFRNGATIEVGINDHRTIRSRTCLAIIGDECCFWRTEGEGASSDEEVIAAAEPAMATVPGGGFMVLSSSPFRPKGLMHRRWREYHGNDNAADVCWVAPSRVMNPSLPQSLIDRAMADDPMRARSEYMAEWRSTDAEFVPDDVIQGCTDWGVRERSPEPGVRHVAFADAAGGTGKDSYALAIASLRPSGEAVLELLRERKPRFVPAAVTKEYADLVKLWGITQVHGDQWAKGWVSDEWSRNGIQYCPSRRNRSEIYLAALPLLLSGRARLLDSPVLRQQLASLERRVHAGGRESVDHAASATSHDDACNASCGALVEAAAQAKQKAIIARPIVVSGRGIGAPGSGYHSNRRFMF